MYNTLEHVPVTWYPRWLDTTTWSYRNS